MDILIDTESGTPIYEQIYDRIKSLIVSGGIAENELLPSMRGLAKGLRISVITTKRAYEELERDGYIYTISGKGSFAAKQNRELVREDYLRRIEEHLDASLELAKTIGLSSEDMIEMIRALEDNYERCRNKKCM